MRVIIQNDYQKMSQWAANHVIERINEFNPTPDHKFVLGLPTGSSPVGMYNALVRFRLRTLSPSTWTSM